MSDTRRAHVPKGEYDRKKRTRRKLRERDDPALRSRQSIKSHLKELSHDPHHPTR